MHHQFYYSTNFECHSCCFLKVFVHAETSAKVRTALKHPVRQYFDFVFKPKDNVFHKLPTDRRWQGPVYQGYFY